MSANNGGDQLAHGAHRATWLMPAHVSQAKWDAIWAEDAHARTVEFRELTIDRAGLRERISRDPDLDIEAGFRGVSQAKWDAAFAPVED